MATRKQVSDDELSQIIANLQKRLHELVKQKGMLTDDTVVKISQELDKYIVESQRRKRKS
jgi:plasmid maintenance system antidote protein VapI